MSIDIFYSILNFLIFVFLLAFLLRKKIRAFLLSRKENYITNKEQSQEYYLDSNNKLVSIKDKMNNLETDGKNYLERVAKQSSKDADIVLKKAEAIKEQILLARKRSLDADIRSFSKVIEARMVNKIVNRTETNILDMPVGDITNMYIDEYSESQVSKRLSR